MNTLLRSRFLKLILSSCILGSLFLSTFAAQPAAAPSDEVLAKQLVQKLWTAFAKPDTAALKKMMGPSFQSLHEDGPRTSPEELKLISALKLSGYTLDKYQITRSGDVLIVSYMVTVSETIDATRQSKDTMPRMDVFQQINGEWLWLAHANIRPLTLPAK